ncbi:MAG TPA: glutamine amidotransferase [Tepidanaerobacter syntrophicus]|uniref:type 1 glutamine amidotransferase n=1 Tax=Tepidanaerobacter syntrophicus TaxID=224999 RepID=UPI0017589AB0|nr:glutamine amidotransferase [Tepidanaerobacter syntrophicus]HHV83891.1 glutamine amidotransferase [Tepidanaerobacter syntrophicus]
MKLNICHLYPDLMNMYGDSGNMLALIRRCQWRNISVEVKERRLNDKAEDFKNQDIFFIGHGASRQQSIVAQDMKSIKPYLKEAIEEGKVFLAICGGYRILGRYQDANGATLGLELFNFYTEETTDHFAGNIIVETDENYNLIGFENHIGKTYLNGLKPLGRVIFGFGNNGEDKTEGMRYKNTIGTYLHGPLLPNNPRLCDKIIEAALRNKYGTVELEKLDDSLELETRRKILELIDPKFTSLA